MEVNYGYFSNTQRYGLTSGVVGVNSYTVEDEQQIATMRIDPSLEGKQIDRLAAVRARRDGSAVEASLVALRSAAATPRNLMEPLLDAARAHATEGEIVQTLQGVWGRFTETPVF